MSKATDIKEKEDWQIQADVYGVFIGQEETRLSELQANITRCEAIITEIEADLAQEKDLRGSEIQTG